MGPESLNVLLKGVTLKILPEPHHIAKSEGIDVNFHLVVNESHSILVVINAGVVRIAEGELYADGERVNNITVLHPHPMLEDVFHEVMDGVSVN